MNAAAHDRRTARIAVAVALVLLTAVTIWQARPTGATVNASTATASNYVATQPPTGFYDFSTYPAGHNLSADADWNNSSGTWTIVDGAAQQHHGGGYYNGHYELKPADQWAADQFEVAASFPADSGNKVGLVAFGAGGATDVSGYWLVRQNTDVRFVRNSGAHHAMAGHTVLATFPIGSGAWNGRLRYNGDGTFAVTAWLDSTSEPAATVVADSTWVNNGSTLHGLRAGQRSTTHRVSSYGFAVKGLTAPLS